MCFDFAAGFLQYLSSNLQMKNFIQELNPKITMNRPLRIYCYALGIIQGDIKFNSQSEFLNYIPKWGFPVNPYIKAGQGLSFIQNYYKNRFSTILINHFI